MLKSCSCSNGVQKGTLMTLITLSAFALVALAGIAATVKAVATDGYRRQPTR
ncbi:hypothetical protein GCM10009851_33310 [Herbiconiux moechotypicola]|uniref:Uncharacterized protein n=1 Tax=Herbiconiux moechotypicola TaxID=637393 RepID=A0ABN3E0N2_9MICO